jgi:hypothetical protein
MNMTLHAFLFLLAAFSGCATRFEPEESIAPGDALFVVAVDSVQAISPIRPADTLSIHLWGMIGPSGCYSLSRIETAIQKTKIDLTVWGKYVPSEVCTAVIVDMRGTVVKVVPMKQGPFEIVVHQPGGSQLRDTVRVQ